MTCQATVPVKQWNDCFSKDFQGVMTRNGQTSFRLGNSNTGRGAALSQNATLAARFGIIARAARRHWSQNHGR